MDSDYIPVRPNINNGKRYVAPSIMQPPVQKKDNMSELLMKNKDPDVQQVINKNQNNALTMQSKETKEEKESEKEEKNIPESKGTSWVVIILAVIIILLILVIIYYVMNYNNLFPTAPPIPDSVVKPSLYPNAKQAALEVNPYSQSMPPKPKDYVEPTKSDLDSVLNQLNKPSKPINETNNETNIKNKVQRKSPYQNFNQMSIIHEIVEPSSQSSIVEDEDEDSIEYDITDKNEIPENNEIDISEEMKSNILNYDDSIMDHDLNEEFVEQGSE